MNHFCIITNEKKDRDLAVTKKIQEFLEKNGKTCTTLVAKDRNGGAYTDKNSVPEDVDCVISLGGDGTLIQAARDMAGRDVAFVGVNLGTLGFLADVERDTLEESMVRLLNGEYLIENRIMLEGEVLRKEKSSKEDSHRSLALNDVVINRAGPLSVIEYKIFVNHNFLTSYRADGVIICTPTGSTGYSLSAGGPIIEPGSKMMMITPICAHTLNARSILLRPEDEVTIEADWDSGETYVEASFDGEDHVKLRSKDAIRIAVSEKTTAFVRLSEESFVTLLSRKLGG